VLPAVAGRNKRDTPEVLRDRLVQVRVQDSQDMKAGIRGEAAGTRGVRDDRSHRGAAPAIVNENGYANVGNGDHGLCPYHGRSLGRRPFGDGPDHRHRHSFHDNDRVC